MIFNQFISSKLYKEKKPESTDRLHSKERESYIGKITDGINQKKVIPKIKETKKN